MLPLVEEDVDALSLYMEIHKSIWNMEQHVRYSTLNYEDGLIELKSIHEKVSKMDSTMQGWIKPVEVISYLTGIIAKHLAANKVAKGYQIIFSVLCESKSIVEASTELHQLTGSDRYKTMLDPTNKEFVYHLSEHDCFMRRTGKCSLELSPQELQEYLIQDKDNRSDSSVSYCRNLLQSFQQKGIQCSVDIQHNTACGHYTFTGGQHRTCIAKKTNISVPANVAEQQTYCKMCSSQRSGDKSFIDKDDYIA
ncbi:hypothetical protein [Paenibacillus sp. V4I7]|nr:hypothetical protein [Paenibacillus sp. V4I7]MDQ0896334.1 hypothetical protein [Paenibacillus sp. V4I7]